MTTNRPTQASYSQDLFYFAVSNFNLAAGALVPLFSLSIIARKI